MAFLGSLVLIVLIFFRPQDFMTGLRALPLVDVIMGVVILGWLMQLLGEREKVKVSSQQNYLMILFWGIVVISTINANWLGYTFNTFVDWGKITLIYFALVGIVNSEKRLKIFMLVLVLSLTGTALMGILQYYGYDITGVGTLTTCYGERIRGAGIFDTNQLAYVLVFILPVVFAFLTLSRTILGKSFFFIIACAYTYCIYLTKSRGGLTCLLAVFALLFVIFARKKFTKAIGIILCVFLVIGVIAISPRLASTKDYKNDESSMGRVDVWGSVLSTLKSQPLTGIGKGRFTEYFVRASHNSYISVLSELGVIGLFIWLSIFYFSFKHLRAIAYSDKNSDFNIFSKKLAKAFTASLFAYLIGSMFSSSAYYLILFILFSQVVVLQNLHKIYKGEKDKEPFFRKRDFISITMIEICIILFLHGLVRFSYGS